MEDVQGSMPDARPPQAVQSQAAAGKVIGKLSSKNMKLLDKTNVMPDFPFSRSAVEFQGPKNEEVRRDFFWNPL